MSMPIVEPPPGRFSTSACCPRFSDNFAARRRNTTSVRPPGVRGGTDRGPAPYERLLASLAGCTASTLRMVAARKGWELGSIHGALELHKDAEGGRDRITRVISLTGPLDDRQKAALADIAEKTPVTKTIKAGATIETKFS